MAVIGKIFKEGLEAVAKKSAQLNVGLKVGDEVALTPDDVIKAVEARGGKVKEAIVVRPETDFGSGPKVEEPTVVVKLAKPLPAEQVDQLAVDLKQDAIPQRYSNGQGIMAGPDAAKWGEFNPNFFVEMNQFWRRHTPNKDLEIGALTELGDRYPEVAPPIQTWDPKKRAFYDKKDHSPEEATLLEKRRRVTADMEREGFDPYFDPAQRKDVPAGTYPDETATLDHVRSQGNTTASRRAGEKWEQVARDPQAIERLKAGYAAAVGDPNAVDWYAVGQLYDKFVDVWGPEEAAARFQDIFADPMAATTGGADPTANLLSAAYGNFQRATGQGFPKNELGNVITNQVPSPVGGRYLSGNLGVYDSTLIEGLGLTEEMPKRLSFSRNFRGNRESPTIDEQMSGAWNRTAPQTGQYGMWSEVTSDVARELGVDPRRFQEVAWAGLKGTEGDPMINHINRAVERTARVTGKTPDEVVEGMVRGNKPLYATIGAGVLAGMTASPNEAEAGVFGRAASQFIKQAENIAGRVRRGDIDPATGMRLMTQEKGPIDRLNKLGGQVITPEERQAATDAIWEQYGSVQSRAMSENPFRPETRAQTDLPADDGGGLNYARNSRGEVEPYRTQRPLTPEEAGELDEFSRWERLQQDLPSQWKGYFGESGSTGRFFNDPYSNFSPEISPETPANLVARANPTEPWSFPAMEPVEFPPQYVPQRDWGPSWFESQGISPEGPRGAGTLGFDPEFSPGMFRASRVDDPSHPSFTVRVPTDVMRLMDDQLKGETRALNDPWMVTKARRGARDTEMVVRNQDDARAALEGALSELEERASTATGGAKRRLNRQIQRTRGALDDVNNPDLPTDNPQKRMFSVGGAAGMGYALSGDDSEAADPGLLAAPTVDDLGGRIMAAPDAEEAKRREDWARPANSTWASITGTPETPTQPERHAEVLAGLPGFIYNMANDVTGMISAGSYGVGQMGAGLVDALTGKPAKNVETIAEEMGVLRDMWDSNRIQDNATEHAIMETLMSSPAAMEALMTALKWYGVGGDKMEEWFGPEGRLFYEGTLGAAGEMF